VNPEIHGDPVRALQGDTRARIEAQLARISHDHGVEYYLNSIGGTICVVVGMGKFACERVGLWRKGRVGTFLAVDGERVMG